MSVDTRIYDAYLACALRSGDLDGRGFSVFDFGKTARDETRAELEDFVQRAGDLLNGLEPAQIGHDFWLARNGDAATFWDEIPGARGAELTAIARTYDSKVLCVGTDGKVYFGESPDSSPISARF